MQWYKFTYLARNSEAYKLWEAKEFSKLDKHLKQLQRNAEDLIKHYEGK